MPRQRARHTAFSAVTILALVATGLQLSAPAATAALEIDAPEAVRAAAYLGADQLAETSLPSTVQIGGESHAVEWSFDQSTFAVPYQTVQVNGSAGGTTVSADVEVLPPAEHPLVYFVDAGHNGDSQSTPYSNLLTGSQAFESAESLAGETLRNTTPDLRYVDGTTPWGWLSDATNNYKISVAGGDPNPADAATLGAYGKHELGVRTNGTQIAFRLDLDPGQYTLSSGFYEFYAGTQARSRGILPTIEYQLDGATQQQPLEQIVVSTPANTAPSKPVLTSAFTIPDGASAITLRYMRSAGEAPVLSWFAVADGNAEAAIEDAIAANAAVIDVAVDADTIASDNVNGLTFKGFGTLSANSTSAVLMDYKSEHPEKYSELLRTLFGGEHPIMHHVKIEMGNDRNNSTGSDAATKRTADEPANVTRNPGFQLAADALKLNPGLKTSILRWNAPAWADNNDKIYDWYKETILAAYREYGYMVDYVNPGVNEHTADLTWTKQYALRVRTDTTGFASDTERDLYNSIEIVISDEVGTGTFGGQMVADAELRDAVSVAGFHYNTNDDGAGNFKRLAQDYDVEVWNSEAQATFSNTSFRQNNNVADPTTIGTGIGGTGGPLEMANTVVKGFVNSNRTHFIYQPAIGSFFEGGQYSFKELVSARDPWSGWIHYDGGIAVLQHFSNFAVTGWENDDNTAGIWRAVPSASATTATGTNPVNGRNGLQNYITLAAPDASDFSTVFVNDSEKTLTYRVTPTNFTFDNSKKLNAWETRAADAGESFDANYKQHLAEVSPSATGVYTVTVKPFSIVTLTSLDVTGDAGWTTPLPVEGERTVLDTDAKGGALWSDGFEYADRTVPVFDEDGNVTSATEPFIDSRGGDTGAIPLFTWDRNGSFEAYKTASDGYVLRQQVDRTTTGVGGAWNGGDPLTAVGDRRWVNYTASVDVRFERAVAGDNYAAIGARSSGGGSSHTISGTPYVLRLNSAGTWEFRRTGSLIESGTVTGTWSPSAWHELQLTVTGARIVGSVNGAVVFDWTDPTPFRSGWVDLASGFYNTQFDNLSVDAVDGWLPYYGEYLDGLEMNDLSEEPAEKLVYDGGWSHANGGGMFEYQRSLSRSTAVGASVSYTFTGSGVDLIAPGDGSARLNVIVDGETIVRNAPTQAAASFQAAYSLRGLAWGEHTVRFEVVSGTLVLDAVAVTSESAGGVADAAALADAVDAASGVTRTDDYSDADWALFQTVLAQAGAAVADPAAFRLDGEGAQQLDARLQAAAFPIAAQITSLPTPIVATTVGETPALPETLTATLLDGTTREVPITWNLDGVDVSAPWASVAVAGAYGSATTTARIEVVPADTTFFADINGTAGGSLGYDSPTYLAITQLLGDQVINAVPDQVLTGDRTWGHWGRNAAGTSTVNYKGIVAGPYDKLTTTGMYASDQVGASIGYTMVLPAGTHTITAGSHSWWPDYSRTANVALTYGGQTHQVGSVTLDTSNRSKLLSYEIELAEAGTVTLSLTSTVAQSPMLSWVAASGIAEESPVSAEVTSRCVAGKVMLVVSVANAGSDATTVSIATPFGNKQNVTVAADKTVNSSFATRQGAIEAGTVTVSGDGFEVEAPLGARSCG